METIEINKLQSVIDEKLRHWLDRRSAHHDPVAQAVMNELNSIRVSTIGQPFTEAYKWIE